jgi:hypothetical protein
MKKLVAIILAIALSVCVAGCNYNHSEIKTADADGRIEYMYNDGFTIIVRDAQTGVEYISRANAGTCVVVDATGMPYIEDGFGR